MTLALIMIAINLIIGAYMVSKSIITGAEIIADALNSEEDNEPEPKEL